MQHRLNRLQCILLIALALAQCSFAMPASAEYALSNNDTQVFMAVAEIVNHARVNVPTHLHKLFVALHKQHQYLPLSLIQKAADDASEIVASHAHTGQDKQELLTSLGKLGSVIYTTPNSDISYDTELTRNPSLGIGYLGGNLTVLGATTLHDNITGSGWARFTGSGTGLAVTNNATIGGNMAVTGSISGSFTGTAGAAVYAHHVTSDSYNNVTAGSSALSSNLTGSNNTAVGYKALSKNTDNYNTAVGTQALQASTSGSSNTAVGFNAMQTNVSGYGNTALGIAALQRNNTGACNTAIGGNALQYNTNNFNTAIGSTAMQRNLTGGRNVAIGYDCLSASTSGGDNVAIGLSAMNKLTTGGTNIAIGLSAGSQLTGGEIQNIYIGNPGGGGESSTIRLGSNSTHTSCFIAGISGITASGGTAVYINSGGQLGTTTSSRRYKDDIQTISKESERIMQLRPVSFSYKTDPAKQVQFGLIAEEVEQVMPELVVYKDNKPETVAYHLLTPLLLNEAQNQNKRLCLIEAKTETLDNISKRIDTMQQTIANQASALTKQKQQLDHISAHFKVLGLD